MMFFIILMVSIGYLPLAVSSLSITASAPTITAVATSETSALVGSGDSVIDANIESHYRDFRFIHALP